MVSGPSRVCAFCGQETETRIEASGQSFCSTGCRDAEKILDGGGDKTNIDSGVDKTDIDRGGNKTDTPAEPRDDKTATERAFFHIAGMHGPTCERFLERRAKKQSGVSDAEASYVTETIRVEYVPEEIGIEEIVAALSVVGYRAVSREETSGEAATTVLADPRDEAERALDDLLGFRYIAGIVFGTFLLMPYIVVLYPAQFSLLPVEFFEDGALSSGAIPLFLLLAGTTACVILFTGLPLLRGAYISLRMRRPSTDLLATLTVLSAFIYGSVAVLAGRIDLYFDLAMVVAAVVVAAIYYESLVKRQAMERLTDLTLSRPREARVALPSGTTDVDIEDLRPDDLVLVREGERIPVNGTLTEGRCTVDESVITGESRPVRKATGDELVGGSVVIHNSALVRVGDPPTSRMDRLTTAVWLLQSATHGLQRRADRVAGVVVPALIAIACLAVVGSLALTRGVLTAGFAGLTVVLVLCPWGLALSTPLTVAANLRASLARGIVISDETVFERLDETDVVVFDKTGTLTAGTMRIIESDASDELLEAAALLERRASHPAAVAIAETAVDSDDDTGTDDETATAERVTAFESHAWGVAGNVDGVKTLVGHPDLFTEQGWRVDSAIKTRVETARTDGHLPVVVGQNGHATGVIVLADERREGWQSVVSRLANADVEVVVLTGDDASAAARFEEHPAMTTVFAGVPPAGKVEVVRRLQATDHVTMVGDGTNDAPALAQADLGVALGSGTALATDAADVALAEDDLETVETTFEVARAANRRVTQNVALALSYNVVAVGALAVGLLNPATTMAGVVLAGGLLALNTSRPLLSE